MRIQIHFRLENSQLLTSISPIDSGTASKALSSYRGKSFKEKDDAMDDERNEEEDYDVK